MSNDIQYLYVSYENRQDLIKLGGKWDPFGKRWYIKMDKMTLDLEPYIEYEVDIPQAKKNFYKKKYSIKWCPTRKTWITSLQIFEQIDEDRNNLCNDSDSE